MFEIRWEICTSFIYGDIAVSVVPKTKDSKISSFS